VVASEKAVLFAHLENNIHRGFFLNAYFCVQVTTQSKPIKQIFFYGLDLDFNGRQKQVEGGPFLILSEILF